MPARRGVSGAIAAVIVAASAAAVATVGVAPVGAQAPPAMTVEPSSDLVDGDAVTVSVSGLAPDAWVDVVQCVSVPVDVYNDCDLADYVYDVAGDDGTATLTLRVDAILTTGYPGEGAGREVDCRATACVVGLSTDEGATLMTAPLGFRPDGPLAPPPTVSVTPDTDLTDYETVAVVASGLVWSGQATVLQCASDPAGPGDCDHSTASYRAVDDAGSLTIDHTVVAVVDTPNRGPVDCREPGSCVLTVSSDSLRTPGKAALAPLSFDPDTEIATATLTITPGSGLVDGQRVTVSGAGFRPSVGEQGSWLEVYECTSDVSFDRCEWIGWADVDGTGAFTTEATVWAVLATPAGDVDCRTSTEPCQVVATPGSPTSMRAGRADLAFAEDGPLLPAPAIEVTPSHDLTDGANVTVTGTGFSPDGWGRVTVCAAGDVARCDDQAAAWVGVSASGTFAVDLSVAAVFETWMGDQVDCTAAPGCAIAAQDGMRRRWATAGISFAPPSNAGQRYIDPVFDEVETISDVVYRETTDAHGAPVQLTLDLHQPAGDTAGTRPVVVWLTGGWFGAGDDGVADTYARDLARRGYVVAVVDYRTRPDLGCCPTRDAVGVADALADATEDGAAAVAWLREHAGEHRLDPEAIAAGGTDGGAAVSYGLAYPGQDRGRPHDMHGAPPSIVAAALPVSGVSVGEPQAGASPVLAFHGGAGLTAPAHLSEWTCTAAEKVGDRCDVVTYAGAGDEIATTKRRDIVNRSAAFLADVMLAPRGYIDTGEAPVTTSTVPPTTTSAAPATAQGDRAHGKLARTGANGTVDLVRIGMGTTALGAALLVLSRRRRRRARVAGTEGS